MADRKIHPQLAIFDDDNRWTALPVFFVNDLMRLGKEIPPSFWKFTWVMLRYIFAPGKDGEWPYTWKITEKQLKQEFNIDSKAAARWTRAYSVSGLFWIHKGTRHQKDLPGEPTFWTYNKKATLKEWQAFILALSSVCGGRFFQSGARIAYDGITSDGFQGSKGYAVILAVAVDQKRAVINGTIGLALPPVNTARIEGAIKQGFVKRSEDGTLVFMFRNPSRKGLEEPSYHGEPDGDWNQPYAYGGLKPGQP
jgi:hypothetical protein